MMTKCPL